MGLPKLEKISSNRSFGLVFFAVFLIISLWPLKHGGNLIIWSAVLSFIFLTLGILNSRLLYPLNKLWNYLGIFLGMIVSPLVMGVIFFLVVSPIGIIMRIFRKDLLRLKVNKSAKSYWIAKQKIKSTMRNQF
tara:strand:- start:110 stop:505 length:396 start_codon:yes stop_codon:yes gene_type:complete